MLRIPRRGTCRRVHRAMGIVHSDPCPKIVGTRVVHCNHGPYPINADRICTIWLKDQQDWVAESVVGRWRNGRRMTCVIFACSGERNVEPCRRAAVLQGKKDASRMSSASHACGGDSGWVELDCVESGSRQCLRTHKSRLLPIQRAGHGKGRDEAAFRVHPISALRCTAMHSALFWRF